RALLAGVTGSEWRVTTFWFRRPVLAHFSFPEWPVAAFVQNAPWRPRLGQWVVVKRELVHDPGEWAGYTGRKYPRPHCRIASAAPAGPQAGRGRAGRPRWPGPGPADASTECARCCRWRCKV